MSAGRLFPGFSNGIAKAGAIQIPYIMAGSGPPLLLLHGHPQTHAIWHKIAPALAQSFTVIASDLRGYGDASKPAGLPDHSNYSKREMAGDQLALMQGLGFERFSLVGHDRGGRVGHRLAMDHPHALESMMLLDISPTLAMYEQTSMEFARAYWHWFFLIQPAPLPERLIGADPEFYLREYMGKRSAGMRPFAPEAWAEYLRAMSDPACVHAMCEDYRAAATIDLEHDRADRDAGKKANVSVARVVGQARNHREVLRSLKDWGRVAKPSAAARSIADTTSRKKPRKLCSLRSNSFSQEENMATHRIAVIPGDGIGTEVIPEGIRVLDAAARKFGIDLRYDEFDFASCDYYAQHGQMMPDDWKAQIGGHDAIFFGAVGWPEKVPDHISLWGSLLLFRREFDQYVNLRPVRLMPGVASPLANQARRHRFLRRARKHRGRVLLGGRQDVRRHRPRDRPARSPSSAASVSTASCATPSNWRGAAPKNT